MSNAPSEQLVAELAGQYATALRSSAARARNEEEIRIASERQLAVIAEKAGVLLDGRHEFTVASGRIDSVYERVLIEYKNPVSPADRIGASLDSAGTVKLIAQIKRRFADLETELGHAPHSLLGVGIDGNRILFVRLRKEIWEIDPPTDLDRPSARRLLWALFNLGTSGKPYSPVYLAEDFGPSSTLARASVTAFYDADHAGNAKSKVFFEQWQLLFGEVCGYEAGPPNDKLKNLARTYGVPIAHLDAAKLLFAIQTYYVLFMKLMAAQIMGSAQRTPSVLRRLIRATTRDKLFQELQDLEDGSVFRHSRITNFLEGDLFSWYLAVWTPAIEVQTRSLVESLDAYNPGTLSEDPTGSRDLLKNLYQALFPRAIRHDLGEYYTPDWLAQHVLDEVGYIGDPDHRILDPACGSGTFLVLAINRVREWYERNRERCHYDEGELCKKILANVTGFELNPLAVMASRTNYLIAIRDLLEYVDNAELPVYLCDAVVTPSAHGELYAGTTDAAKELRTSGGVFIVPSEVAARREVVSKYAEQLEFCVRNDYNADEFLARCAAEQLGLTKRQLHVDLYNQLLALQANGRNGIWARIIKNSFAPLFIKKQDFVVGNPPWVNWESLPKEYRDSTKSLWSHYGLFTLKGHEARLGGGKKDISMLFLYVAVDNYLAENGVLGFVLTQTLFKSRQAGEGFRKFAFDVGGGRKYILPSKVTDLTDMRPFAGTTNRTALCLCRHSKTPIRYPLDYESWHLDRPGALSEHAMIGDVIERRVVRRMVAVPMVEGAPSSAWMTTPRNTLSGLRKVAGRATVTARAGVCTWMNGVFWLKSVGAERDGSVLVTNWHDVGKKEVREVEASVEASLVYPLLRGRDLHRWRSKPSTNLLLTQDPSTRRGIPTDVMKRNYPKTYQYLRAFEAELRSRSGFKQYFDVRTDPYWSIYNVGPYSVAPHRVAYKEFSEFFQCAVVVQDRKPTICDTKLRFIECASADEAHLLCGLLNSSPSVLFLYATAAWVQTADYQASDISRLALPRFDPEDPTHVKISALSRECHNLALANGSDFTSQERELETLAGALWGLEESEIVAMRAALDERGFYRADAPNAAIDDDDD